MRKRLILISAACAALQLGLAASASAGTLDQQQTTQDAAPALFGSADGPQSLAQTFTAGITGGLDQVDLMLQKLGNPPSPITIQIRSVSAGLPGGLSAVLATASLPTASVGTTLAFVPVPISPPVPVTTGTQYAITAYNDGTIGNAASWAEKNGGNPYAGGAESQDGTSFPPDNGWFSPLPDIDMTFKTYVAPTPAAVPVPVVKKKKCKKKKKHRHATAAKKKKCKKKRRK
jgi:hypothetical protein